MDKPPPLPEAKIPSLNLNCPHCQVQLAIHPRLAGTTAACPSCGGKFQIPLPTAQTGMGAGQAFISSPNADYRSFVGLKTAAGICGILLGGIGVHKFILGLNTAGIIMLTVWLVGLATGTCLVVPFIASIVMNVIGLVEGIIYLTKSDEDFYETYAVQRKEWF